MNLLGFISSNHLTTGRLFLALICFLFYAALTMWAITTRLDRLDSVNERLPTGQQFNLLGWSLGKQRRFEKQYVELFPERKARRREYILFLLAGISLLGFAISVGPLL